MYVCMYRVNREKTRKSSGLLSHQLKPSIGEGAVGHVLTHKVW